MRPPAPPRPAPRPPLAWLAPPLLSLAGCGLLGGPSSPAASPTPPPADPAARCKTADGQDQPLVTEWSASDKAYLESLAGGQAIAVQYIGCEMRVLGSCKLPGRYAYQRTPLATETVEIQSSDELYAKLPLGAYGLEGELSRSGRLAVRSTVSGQLKLEGAPDQLPPDAACLEATHLISAIRVGAFSLLTGGARAVGGSVDAGSAAARGSSRREESVMRQAGDAARCADGDDKAPNPQCASPIQVSLRAIGGPARAQAASDDRRAREQGVLLDLPAPKDPADVWKLYNAEGQPLCQLPCARWVAPRSGSYLERAATEQRPALRIDVPHDMPYAPGTRVTGDYSPGRGSPLLSLLNFAILGVPSGIGALIVSILYVADDRHRDGLLRPIVLLGGIAGASTWWWLYSHEKRLQVRPSTAASRPPVRLSLTPLGVAGEF